MKNILVKLLFTFAVCLSASSFASSSSDNNDVINSVVVNITNATGSDCVLEKRIATNGYIAEPMLFPDAILDKQTLVFTMKPSLNQRVSWPSGYKRKSVLLAYRCNDDRSVIFYTDIIPFQGRLLSRGSIISADRIHLEFKQQYNNSGGLHNTSPIIVEWTLFEKS